MSDSPEWLISPAPVAYPAAIKAMESRVDSIIAGEKPELIWLLEHPPLYTAGTSADGAELKDSARFPVFKSGRGGRYTYHGPGQRVIYAMLDLRTRGKDLRAHVWHLEEWMIRVLSDLGVKGERREGRIGIWVAPPNGKGLPRPSRAGAELQRNASESRRSTGGGGLLSEEKIGAIGVRVRKWVAYHGLALNVDPDLSHFNGIVPCGIAEFGVTSLKKLGVDATMAQIDEAFRNRADILLEADENQRD